MATLNAFQADAFQTGAFQQATAYEERLPTDLMVGPNWQLPTGFAAVVAANKPCFAAFQVLRQVTVTKVRIPITTQSGNVDIGIYDSELRRLGSTGSVAVIAPGLQVLNLLAPVTLIPGQKYWAALSCDNVTAQFGGLALSGPVPIGLQDAGVLMRLSAGAPDAFPLPAGPVTGAMDTGTRFFTTWFF